MYYAQRRAGLVLIVAFIVGLVGSPAGAAPSGALAGSFDTALAIRRVAPADPFAEQGQVLLLVPEGDSVRAVQASAGDGHIVGWPESGALLFVEANPSGALDAVRFSPGGARQVVAGGLDADWRYRLSADGAAVISWPRSLKQAAPFATVQVYDPFTFALQQTFAINEPELTGPALAAMMGPRAYFSLRQPGDALLMLDTATGAVDGLIDLLAAGDGNEMVMDVSLTPRGALAVVGRVNPKDLTGAYVIPLMEPDLTPYQLDGEPRPVAQSTLWSSEEPVDAQRIVWSNDGLAAAVVVAVPGDFGASMVFRVNATFDQIEPWPVRTNFNSCVVFTPDDRWLLFVSEAGDSLLAVPVENPGAEPQVLLTDEPMLDLCEAAWQPPVVLSEGPLTLGGQVVGMISDEAYQVDFPVELEAGQTVTVTMERLTGDLDPYVFLLAPDGTELMRNDDAPEQVGMFDVNAQIVDFLVPSDGRYILRATRFDEERGPTGGEFVLSLAEGRPVAELAIDAGPIKIGAEQIGEITGEQYAYDYTVTLRPGEVITVTMQRREGDLDPFVVILDETGREQARNDDAEVQVGDAALNAQIVDFVAPSYGAYTIRATRYEQQAGSTSGAFSLMVESGDAGQVQPIKSSEIALGGSVTGSISDANYATDYAISLQAGDTFTVSMERQGGDLDAYLVLLGPDGEEVAANDDATTQVGISSLNAQIAEYRAPSAGIYTIRATRLGMAGGDSSGQYLLRVNEAGGRLPDEDVLRVGSTVRGAVTDDAPRVTFELPLESGQTVTLTMAADTSDLDSFLTLFGPDGEEAASNDDAEISTGGLATDAQIAGYTAESSGLYVVEATRYLFEEGSSSGEFTLSVVGGAPDVPVAAEVVLDGGELSFGDSATGEIGGEVFAVEYAIQLEAGVIVGVTMEQLDGDLDPYLILFDPNNDPVAFNDDAAFTVGETALNAEIIGYTVTDPGMYVIRATRYDWEEGTTSGGFKVSVDVGQEVIAQDGGVISVGATELGTITATTFAYDYTIDLEAGQSITVTMERRSGGLDSLLYIYDSRGNLVAENDDAGTQVGEHETNAQIVDFRAPAQGTYTIRATRFFEEGGSSTGRFEMTVSPGK